MPLPVSLYTVSAVIVLDSSGNRIYAKYYDHATEFVNSVKKQNAFERAIHEKTRKQNNQIALVDSHVVLYKSASDITICAVGPSEESYELMIYGAVETIFEALSEIIKPQLDKKSVLEQYDMLVLTIDEVIDRGIIIEIEGRDLAERMTSSARPELTSPTLADFKAPSLSSALNFAKQHIARTILKQDEWTAGPSNPDTRMPDKQTLVVCVTGAAGQIAYALLPAICDGSIFGVHQKIDLRLLDITPMMGVLKGVIMELEDCAWPCLSGISATDDPLVAFKDCDVAVLVGAMPRREGMERKDLLKANAGIFKVQGEALDLVASKDVKVLVVGNPANTNAFIVSYYAPSIPKQNFTALTRLDDNRSRSLLSGRLGVPVSAVKRTIIWGNHSSTQFPDLSHAQVHLAPGKILQGPELMEQIDPNYYQSTFIKTVQTRGAAVIAARKLSSAMSAAKAIADHLRDWIVGSNDADDWQSMAVYSTGSGYPGVPENLYFSLPVSCRPGGHWSTVPSLRLSPLCEAGLKATADELIAERDEALAFLQQEGTPSLKTRSL